MVKITMSKIEYGLLLAIVSECKAYTEILVKQSDNLITRKLAQAHLENIERTYEILIYNKEFID